MTFEFWAGRPRSGAELEELGASPVPDVADTATQADVVVVCVFTDEQVREVCLDGALLPAMAAGSGLVVHTTASPNTIEAIAARADDVDVVDAAVSGGPARHRRRPAHAVRRRRRMTSVTRVRPVLTCYGDPVLHVGPRGAGQKVKLVNNALFAGHIGLLAEAVRLGERLGVPESTLLAALPHGSATSRVLAWSRPGLPSHSFIEMTGEFVAQRRGRRPRHRCSELGSDLGVLDDVIKAIGVGDMRRAVR